MLRPQRKPRRLKRPYARISTFAISSLWFRCKGCACFSSTSALCAPFFAHGVSARCPHLSLPCACSRHCRTCFLCDAAPFKRIHFLFFVAYHIASLFHTLARFLALHSCALTYGSARKSALFTLNALPAVYDAHVLSLGLGL